MGLNFFKKMGAKIQVAKLNKSLFNAAKVGSLSVVKAALENGADVNAKTNDGWTALMYASYKKPIDVAKLLIENGADVNAKTNDGWTALMGASDMGHTDVAKMLTANGWKW